MELSRIIIYTKDVQRITGKSDRYARKIMKRIRAMNGKQKYQPVSLTEFCNYMGLTTEEVSKYLTG
jgi:hypothetical protein